MDDIPKMAEGKLSLNKSYTDKKSAKIPKKDIAQAKQAFEIAERISQKVDFYKSRRNTGNAVG